MDLSCAKYFFSWVAPTQGFYNYRSMISVHNTLLHELECNKMFITHLVFLL